MISFIVWTAGSDAVVAKHYASPGCFGKVIQKIVGVQFFGDVVYLTTELTVCEYQ